MSISEEESVTAGGGSVGRRWSEAQKREIAAETRLHELLSWQWKAERQQALAA